MVAVLAAHAQKGLPAFGIYGHEVQDADAKDISADVRDKLALRKQDDKALDAFGQEIASRLEAKVAGVRRRCEEQNVDTALLRSAVTEVEILLAEVVADDDAVVTAVREPDHFEEVLRRRARGRRQKVEEAAEPFFDELVKAIAEEFTRLAPVSPSFTRGTFKSLLDKVEEIQRIIESNGIETAPPRPCHIRFGSRPMEAIGFIPRREQEALLDAVFNRTAPRTVTSNSTSFLRRRRKI